MYDHPSVDKRLKSLENAVQLLEERDQANLRRIEQLAARVRELEQPRSSNDVAD